MGAGSTSRAEAARRLGAAGEEQAAQWYLANGYEVIARNWSCRQGELDLVARRGRLYVFCEVKTRSSDVFGVPAEAVGRAKQVRLRRLAAAWLARQPRGAGATGGHRGGPVRFDVASVLCGRVEVIEAAF